MKRMNLKKYFRDFLTIIIFSISIYSYFRSPKVDVYFSSVNFCANILVSEIDRAERSIEFAVYVFTDRRIYKAIERAIDRGVDVKGVIERKLANSPLTEKLRDIPNVKIIGRSSGIMHHKFMIVDRKRVISGSYNYTYSAHRRNDENFFIVSDKRVVAKFLEEFLRLWQ